MKRTFLIPFFLFLYISVSGQIQDLTHLAQGDLVYSDIIYDNDNDLWGYFYLYKADKEKDKEKMEYVVLDKNLNKTNNGTYYTKKLNSNYYFRVYNNCNLMGDQLVLDISCIMSDGSFVYNSNRTISLTDNSTGEEFIFENGAFRPVPENLLKYNISKSRVDSLGNKLIVSPVYRGDKKGYMVSQHNPWGMDIREKEISFYNENKELMWNYRYNPNTSNKSRDKYTTYSFLSFNDNKIMAIEYDYVKSKNTVVRIISQDFSTGKKNFEYVLQNDSSKYFHRIMSKLYNDTLYIAGQYFNNKLYGSDSKFLGYFRIVVDKNGNEISRKYTPWKELSTPELSISDKGKIFKTHALYRKSTLIYKDGSVSIVNEEVREQPGILSALYMLTLGILNFGETYVKDAYVFNFDKSFNFSGVNKIEKTLNHVYDNFLYSQYIKENSGAVICFTNNNLIKGVKETELLINTVENGKMQTEKIPLTSKKKYAIVPIPAKEGYIMLREYNEKDKYNQIRLERLNY